MTDNQKWWKEDGNVARDMKCPFYIAHSDRGICCEGITDTSKTVLIFDEPNGKRQQMRTYCMGHYDCCEICRMLMREKYGD